MRIYFEETFFFYMLTRVKKDFLFILVVVMGEVMCSFLLVCLFICSGVLTLGYVCCLFYLVMSMDLSSFRSFLRSVRFV